MPRQVSAVIFDLDGVIVESEQLWDRVRHRFVEEHGGHWRADSSRHMMGMSTRAWAEYLVHDLGVRLSVDDTAQQVIDEMCGAYEADMPLIPGAAEAVVRVSELWPLGLASGSRRVLISTVLQAASLDRCFHVVVSSDEVPAGKPEPHVYLEAASRLNVTAAECVVIEDSTNGILAGAAAGCRVIAIPNRLFAPDARILASASTVLEDIHELTGDVIRGLPRERTLKDAWM